MSKSIKVNEGMKETVKNLKMKNKGALMCCICDREILPGDGEPFYIQTKRGNDLYLHNKCTMDRR